MARWNDNWRDELDRVCPIIITRLAECRSRKSDIPIMAGAMKKFNPDKTAEDCLDRMIEWLGENNQFFDFTDAEWNDLLFDIDTY